MNTSPVRIVVVEDEVAIRRFLRAFWRPEEAQWHEAGSADVGIRLIAEHNPDVVLLDLGLPDMDGLEALKSLRSWTEVPIIVLTARGQERDKVAALELGADDYVTKPFSNAELRARVRAAVRRAKSLGPQEAAYEVEGLRVDFVLRQVHLDGREVHLTPIEYRLLALLARHPGRVLTHRALLREVWGPAHEDATHTLRVHMASIRRKIEPDPTSPRYIRTETSVGYRLLDVAGTGESGP
jgi:two-component system KDP operon response regulator KdpE